MGNCMTEFASDLPDFQALLANTATFKKLPAAIIEKDYFVVRALRALCGAIPDQFVFKGGTSLSKGWNLIDRFSEDIDLLFGTDDGKGGQITKGDVDRRLANAEKIVTSTKGFRFVKQDRSRGLRRCSYFEYPRIAPALAIISNTVQLEMGTRGGTEPSSIRTIRSFITEFIDANGPSGLAHDLTPFEIRCLDVRRTVVEKLFAVHAAFEKDRVNGCTRHYYDLYRGFDLAEVRAFLDSPEYAGVFADVQKYTQENWKDAALPPNGKFSASAAFAPGEEDLALVKRHYRAERDLFFIEPPTMEEILERLGTTIKGLGI
jgi:hypothetical protein